MNNTDSQDHVEQLSDEAIEKITHDIMLDLGFIPVMTGKSTGYLVPTEPSQIRETSNNIFKADSDSPTGSSIVNTIVDWGAAGFTNFIGGMINSHPITQTLPSEVKSYASQTVATQVARLAKWAGSGFIGVNVNDNYGDGGNKPDPLFKGVMINNHSHVALDYNAPPIEVNLDTGITPNTYSPLYHKSTYSYSSPLHLTYAKFQIPTDLNTDVAVYFNSIISYLFTNSVQNAVSYSVNTSLLATTTLTGMLGALCNAIQVYYWYDSILMYTNNPLNKNEGMLALRQQISATDVNALSNLRRVLAGTPVPPNLFNLIYYLMQTYQTSDLPGSSLIKICPIPNSTSNKYPDSSIIQTTLSSLLSYEDSFSLLSRACPEWVLGELPGSSVIPLHDEQFTTIWINLPYYHYKKASGVQTYSFVGPAVVNTTQSSPYNSYSNTLDGAAYALFGLWNSTNSKWYPSFIIPITNNYQAYSDANNYTLTNRMSYYVSDSNGSNPGLYDAYGSRELCLMRDETWQICSEFVTQSPQAALNFGSQICLNVSASTVSDTALKLSDWLITFNKIGRHSFDTKLRHKTPKHGKHKSQNKSPMKKRK